jgi:hypothetical protein
LQPSSDSYQLQFGLPSNQMRIGEVQGNVDSFPGDSAELIPYQLSPRIVVLYRCLQDESRWNVQIYESRLLKTHQSRSHLHFQYTAWLYSLLPALYLCFRMKLDSVSLIRSVLSRNQPNLA